MSFRNKKMDRRYRLTERRRVVGLREAVADSFFEALRVGRMTTARAIAATTIPWPAPLGEH